MLELGMLEIAASRLHAIGSAGDWVVRLSAAIATRAWTYVV